MPPKIVMSKIGTSVANGDPIKKKKTKHSLDFQDELNKKVAEHKAEVSSLRVQIEAVKRNNERLLRKQERMFGATLDDVEMMKRDLAATLATNDRLYREMEETKQRYKRLKGDLTTAKQRVATATSDISDYKKESKVWRETANRFLKTEETCKDLADSNKAMRYELLKSHINPNAKVAENETTGTNTKGILKVTVPTSNLGKNTKWKNSKPPKRRQSSVSWGQPSTSDVFENIRRRIHESDSNSIRRATQSYEGYFDKYKHTRGKNVTLPKIIHAAALTI